jgi:spore coat protein U-like protein
MNEIWTKSMEYLREEALTRSWLLVGLLSLSLFAGQRTALGASAATCDAALNGVPPTKNGTPGSFTYSNVPLSFGSILASAGGGTVTVDPATGLATSAGVTLLGTGSSAAAFSIYTGSAKCSAQSMTITVASPAVLSSGANTMTITGFTTSPATGSNLGVNGAAVPLTVGGTLNVGPNQAAGNYSGTFTVTVTFP